MPSIGSKIREIRESLEMTQAEFARKLDASQGSVSKWEKGKEKPSADIILRLALQLGAPIKWLSDDEDYFVYSGNGVRISALVGEISPNSRAPSAMWSEDRHQHMMFPFPSHIETYWDINLWKVAWPSHYLNFPPETIIFATAENDAYLESDDIVIIDDFNSEGHQVGLARFVIDRNGDAWIWPLDKISIGELEPICGISSDYFRNNMKILGLVIGSANFEITASLARRRERALEAQFEAVEKDLKPL